MSLLGEVTYALITPSSRAIATLIPHVVMEEHHRDGLIVTHHPVEKGSAITDHAFKSPAEVEMRCGWSNSTAGSEGFARQVYQKLLALQAKRQPFTLSTGKRRYTNMLLTDLGIVTDPRSENVLLVNARFQEIIIVSTQTTNTGSAGAGGNQASPENTGGTDDLGEQQGFERTGEQTQDLGADDPGSPGLDNPEDAKVGGLDGVPDDVKLPEVRELPTDETPGVKVSPYQPFGA